MLCSCPALNPVSRRSAAWRRPMWCASFSFCLAFLLLLAQLGCGSACGSRLLLLLRLLVSEDSGIPLGLHFCCRPGLRLSLTVQEWLENGPRPWLGCQGRGTCASRAGLGSGILGPQEPRVPSSIGGLAPAVVGWASLTSKLPLSFRLSVVDIPRPSGPWGPISRHRHPGWWPFWVP